MFLRRIVLNGFKSFADRTVFDFGPGITAIVGPNGCGKSNVLDAVRWVLGEQSARSLRGGKMADVIFAGSRSRKPAGAAEVQLLFDNAARVLRSDEDEVVVERVLYRSGESEYRLNGATCRLKDIRDLLLDTGVGVDAYSVIEQGRVDMLLQANPLERREIFEEAAGISRYKVRRIEAQRKLERTQNNLLRLQDIVDELEKRLRSVRLAAGKARNYQAYDARLRELRASYSLAEFHGLEQERLRLAADIADRTQRLHAERVELGARDAEIAQIEHARQALDDEIQAADAALLALQAELSALTERIAQGERRIPELEHARSRHLAQVEEVARRIAEAEQRVEEESRGVECKRAAESALDARIVALQEERRAAEDRASQSRRRLEQARVSVFEAAREGALVQNELEIRRQQHDRLNAQMARLGERQAALQAESVELAGRAGELAERAERLDAEAGAQAQALRDVDARLTALSSDADERDAAIGLAKERRSGIVSRLSLLEDVERRLEGVDGGTQAVLAWREQADAAGGVLGLVADLLRIDDPRVGVLQSVLATFESFVVVRARDAFLAELDRRGQAPSPLRLIAMDRLPAEVAGASFAGAPGFVAHAADWVQCAPEHRRLASALLGRVVVVERLDHALACAEHAPAGYVFVTLAGQTVGTDGRLTFGPIDAAGGLISRKAEIRQLRCTLDDVERDLVLSTRRRMEIEEALSDGQLEKDGLLQRIASLQRDHAEARAEQRRVEEARQRLSREMELLHDELSGLRRSGSEIAAEVAGLLDRGSHAEAAQREHEQALNLLEEACGGLDAAVMRLAHACTEVQVERGRAAEKRAAAEAAVEALRGQLVRLGQQREEAADEADQVAGQIAAARDELVAAQAARQACAARHAEQQQSVLDARARRQSLHQRFEACGAAGRAAQQRVAALEEQVHASQVCLRECEVRLDGLVARVRDELQIDLAEQYRCYEHADQDWDAVKAEIDELRAKIARLGHVNLDAIDELEELTPRYDHLVSQRDDLTTSIDRLSKLIEELDCESRARFSATFEQIRENFQEMFRKLFGGGKADILLEDPDNPLECGIDIIARPPGKEPQSISLLSGGEKTLTTVALLMAVFQSRPSPFAILDEVDAALDEANVERFNSVVQEFLSQTQFVVITHSKRTMACADVLYGVTMEEPGVSKRVSVRFDERVQAPSVA